MITADTTDLPVLSAGNAQTADRAQAAEEWAAVLRRVFGIRFSVLDAESGDVLIAAMAESPPDWDVYGELCRAVARRGRPEFIATDGPQLVLAVPVSALRAPAPALVGVGVFPAPGYGEHQQFLSVETQLQVEPDQLSAHATAAWQPAALERLAEGAVREYESLRRINDLEHETRDLSLNLASTYEEISLLHRLTQNLRLSRSDEELGRIALDWLGEVVPLQAAVLQLAPSKSRGDALDRQARTKPLFLTHGRCPIDEPQFAAIVAHLNPAGNHRPVVMNRSFAGREGWPCPAVRQMVLVALTEGENCLGWLAAINHADDREFGTVEANLLNSVGTILGIHSGNVELYRQQAELLTGIVRALTAAIDAKDQYTCGHSDRVARIAVRIAEEMGCDAKMQNTIYLAGLLHDIGKIGIDDHVLRKPDKLTDEEYEHIKRHVVIGHKILRDLAKLEDVLPVVLHHHESWDGGGYPQRLGRQQIPLPARIVAVADSYDAMGSDRPYRKGMPEEKIDKIFRAGAGQQWDPEIIEAFFRARDDLREIVRDEHEEVGAVEFQNWL